MASKLATNNEIADVLQRIGSLLDAKGENPFRVNSYWRAASLIKDSDRSFAQLLDEKGIEGLTKVRGIGEKLAALIQEYVTTKKVELLEELEKEIPDAEEKESSTGAHRAARSTTTPVKRKSEKKESGRPAGRRNEPAAQRESKDAPPVSVILDVDKEYRKRTEEGSLKLIAPKRLNPEGKAWLPILSTSRGDWRFTAMFSNTAAAHQLGKTDDWVVIYFKKKGEEERQCTVVTEHRGELKDKRVVRGREAESQKYYR